MTGETDLSQLLKKMKPELNPGEFVFCTITKHTEMNLPDAILVFQEKEGVTLIIRKENADQLGLEYSFIASWITLTVHSSLEAVGLTAAISTALAKAGISCNVVAAYYHDHLFVDQKNTEQAMEILTALSA